MIYSKSRKRSTSEATKKIVAARQKWTCGLCLELLSSSYEIDHIKPLWDDGADAICNLMAVCANCHAHKTQHESLVRNERARKIKMEDRKRYEATIRREEEDKRFVSTEATGALKCLDCMVRYYPVFPHRCRKVAERVDARIGRKPHQRSTCDLSPLFSQFYFTAS